jgi:hypothetical protein
VDNHRDELDLMSMQATLFEKGVQYDAPGSVTLGPGTTTWTVKHYHTLTVELLGGGGASKGSIGFNKTFPAGNDGGDTTITSLGLSAFGGKANNDYSGGASGGASGGSTNTAGSPGANGSSSSATPAAGGASAGGAGGTSQTPTGTQLRDGNSASGPGDGGGGSGWAVGPTSTFWTPHPAAEGGAGGGGYCARTYTESVGAAPAWNSVLSFGIGAGGGLYSGGGGANFNGGVGGNGWIKFTWT